MSPPLLKDIPSLRTRIFHGRGVGEHGEENDCRVMLTLLCVIRITSLEKPYVRHNI